MDYKLKRLEKLSGEPVTISSDPEGELVKLDPRKGVRYALTIDVGDLPPKEAFEFLGKARKTIGDFFGDDAFLLIPRRQGQTGLEIYEVEPAQCCERDHDHDGNCDRHPEAD